MDDSYDEAAKKPTMVSLLKLPAKIGTSSDSSHTADPDGRSAEDKLWYLQNLFPRLDHSTVTTTLHSSNTLDEAEQKLINISAKLSKQAVKPKRKRIRMMSDSSNEDATSPISSPSSKKPDLSLASSRVKVPQQLLELPANHTEKESEDEASSEEEVVKSKTKRELIVKFFNVGTIEEVMRMPRCKEKKAELILSLRPFTSWEDLKSKFDEHRVLGPETIENCRELIETRQVVVDLMESCERISERLSHHVSQLTSSGDLGGQRIQHQPSLINEDLKLKSYQLIGINWLLLLYQQKVDGILADEMGLGKTSQTIAFLAYLLEQGNAGPHLIIVPSSTLENWAVELSRWCPSLKYLVYHGSVTERRDLRQQIFYDKESYNIILSTYNVLMSTVDDKQVYKKLTFQYTVLDEAHLLKNMTSIRFKNLMKIQSVRRLLLTGTPFQNDLVELMSLLCFVMPHMFINKEDQLKKMFTSLSRKGVGTNSSTKSFEAERILHAKNIMKPFVLRRLKKDVLRELPNKYNHVEYVSMCPAQQQLYSQLAEKYSHPENGEETAKLDAISQLRFTANHHLLLRHRYTNGMLRKMASRIIRKEPTHTDCNEEYVYEDMQVMSDYELHSLCLNYSSMRKFSLTDQDVLCSGKFQQLDLMLPRIKEKGEKVLIFSQYKLVLNILEDYLRLRSHSYLRLDGSTQVADRLSMIDQFRDDPDLFVFILSTRAGGLGINLTVANHVIIHDIDWNPHNDKQAEDRCHRLGQEKDVYVTRLVSKGTIEAAMLAKADFKLDLERQIQKGDTKDTNVDAVTMLKETLSLWTTSNKT